VDFYVMTEPDLSGNFWNGKYMSGMRSAVRECKGRLVEIDLCDLNELISHKEDVPVILNGRSHDWIASRIEYISQKGIHPILLSGYNNTSQRGVSSLSFDFYGIYTDWCAYMHGRGWCNMALLGVSRDNMIDSVKCEAFRDYNDRYNKTGTTGIYYVDASVKKCCEDFLAEAQKYDVVLCTNDVVSIVLASLLRKCNPKPDLCIHSFWDSPLAEYLKPDIKMISLDYHEMGRQAIRLYSFLVNNPGMESVSAIVRGARYSSVATTGSSGVSNSENNFLRDECSCDVYTLEQLFSVMDEIDLQIIRGIVLGVSYEQIAEKEMVAVGTVKYRVKKMLEITSKASREELMELISQYIGTENILDTKI